MDSNVCKPAPTPAASSPSSPSSPSSAKIVVAGGFGVGKTTFVTAVSEIDPLVTEAVMTEASRGHDDPSPTEDKSTTTVAMDFGRISLALAARPLPLRHPGPTTLLVHVG